MTDEMGKQIRNAAGDYVRQRREEVQAFADSLALGDDLGAVIRAHLYLERELNYFIEAVVDPAVLKVLKPRYHQKVRLAVALGLPERFAGSLSCIGEIRNTFAHELHPVLTQAQVNRFFDALGEDLQSKAQQSFISIRATRPGADVVRSIFDIAPRDQFSIYMVQLWTALVTAVFFLIKGRGVGSSTNEPL